MVFTSDGYRIYGHDFSVNEGSGLYGGFAEHLELLPGSMVYRLREDDPVEQLTFFEPLELRRDVGRPGERRRRGRDRGSRPHGDGDHRRRPSSGCLQRDRDGHLE